MSAEITARIDSGQYRNISRGDCPFNTVREVFVYDTHHTGFGGYMFIYTVHSLRSWMMNDEAEPYAEWVTICQVFFSPSSRRLLAAFGGGRLVEGEGG